MLFGRLTASGYQRFVASASADADTLARLEATEAIGLPGRAAQQAGRNILVPRFG